MFKPNHVIGLSLLVLAACATQTGSEQVVAREKAEDALVLQAPAHGFQIDTAAGAVDPGDDVRVCAVAVLPGSATDVYYVPRIEALLGAHGEELIVHAARPGTDTEAIMDTGASVPCTRAGEAFGEELSEVLATADRY